MSVTNSPFRTRDNSTAAAATLSPAAARASFSAASPSSRASSGSVSAAPGSGSGRASSGSVSVGGGGGKALSQDELLDVLASTFLGKERLAPLRAFLQATSSPSAALTGANFRKLVGFAVRHLESGELPEDTRQAITGDAAILVYFTFARETLAAALAQHTKDAIFLADLNKLQIKPEYANELANALKQRRDSMSLSLDSLRVCLPSIVGVRWRVDVAISTTSLSRVFKPCVLLQLTLSDGRVHTFECSLDKFHELRYAVAKSLKHAQDLTNHPTLTREIE